MEVLLQGKKLVFPWYPQEKNGQLVGFPGSQLELDTVLWQLHRLKYPYEKFNRVKPDKSMIKATELVLKLMDSRLKKNRLPWVLVASESMPLLQALAKIVPMTWALTLRKSCFNVSSVQLMELFSTARPKDDFDADPAGDVLHELTYTSLLVWELLTEQVYGTKGRAGQFADILVKRLERRKNALLVTSYMPGGFTDKTADQMMKDIGERYGQTVKGLLEQEAELRHFKVRVPLPKWTGDEI